MLEHCRDKSLDPAGIEREEIRFFGNAIIPHGRLCANMEGYAQDLGMLLRSSDLPAVVLSEKKNRGWGFGGRFLRIFDSKMETPMIFYVRKDGSINVLLPKEKSLQFFLHEEENFQEEENFEEENDDDEI